MSHTWRVPLCIAAISAAGIASALLGDGLWDTVSWFALGLPVVICIFFPLKSA